MAQLGIIGCGNMGGAILRQWLQSGVFKPEDVIAADKNPAQREKIHEECGVAVTEDNGLAAQASMVLLAVKPQFAKAVGAEIAAKARGDALYFSIIAGYDLSMLHGLLQNSEAHIVRVMPNTPAMVGEGVLAACRDPRVTEEEWRRALQMLGCLGLTEEVTEGQMDAVTGLSGSAPAFAFMFIEALADAGVRAGLPRGMAQRFASQVLAGSGKLALKTGLHPGALKDMVASPAGTTIEGIAALEKSAFRSSVIEAVGAAVEKSKSFHS